MSKPNILKLTDEESNLITEDVRDNMRIAFDQLPKNMQSFLYKSAIENSRNVDFRFIMY